MTKLVTGLILGGSLLLSTHDSSPHSSEPATSAHPPSDGEQGGSREHQKRALGQELVPAGTLYSPGVLVGDTLYVAGLQGTDPRTHKLPPKFEDEVKNCLGNVGRVLKDGGMDYDNVVSVQIFLVDITQFQQVNEIYKNYFKSILPARTTVEVAKLSLGSRIEISAIAQKSE
jgi:2-iminobutanoate/2-iminopropanoate deaminase